MGGEKENGALDTTVSVEEDGSVNEKAGLLVPNENPDALVVTGTKLGMIGVPKPVGAVVDLVGVTPNAEVETGAVTAVDAEEKLKAGAACAADEVGTPNFIPANELAAVVGVAEKENPVLAGVVVEGVILKPEAGAVDVAGGMPNFIWMAGVVDGAATSPGLSVSHATHLITPAELLT